MNQQGQSGDSTAAQPHYVGFWARFLAFLVDSIWVTIIVGLVLVAIYGPEHFQFTFDIPQGPEGLLMRSERTGGTGSLLIELALMALAFILFWIYRSATPGKMIVSAIIADADTLGKPSPGQLVGRYFGYYLSTLVFGLGFVWIAFDKRKQGWHDKLAGTVVIRKPR